MTQERKWNKVKIDNNVYTISVTNDSDRINVLLTDLSEIWTETLTDEIILKRCKNLNPLLNVDALDHKNIMASIFNNLHEHIDEATVEQIKLRIQIEGGSLKFNLNLSKGTQQDLWKIINKPLYISLMELIRQHKVLLDLIKKKDVEIAEYRAQGVELTRQNVKTEVFREEKLKIPVPIPDMNMYINLLHESEHFYNKLDFQKESGVNIESTSDAEQSIDISTNKHSNVSKKDSLSFLSPKSKGKSQKNVNKSKVRILNMVHKKPIKKLNKGLKSFIS